MNPPVNDDIHSVHESSEEYSGNVLASAPNDVTMESYDHVKEVEGKMENLRMCPPESVARNEQIKPPVDDAFAKPRTDFDATRPVESSDMSKPPPRSSSVQYQQQMLGVREGARNFEQGVVVGKVVVREYEVERDRAAVLELERRCEIGPEGEFTLITDLLGDPLCRVRLLPCHVMLVAEYGEGREIAGVIRGCIKTVTGGKDSSNHVKVAYILGLRVSPSHRRLGIGAQLVCNLETWCVKKGADYAYMATDSDNKPSINLFIKRKKYTMFRSLTILVHPVHAHHKTLGSRVSVVRVSPQMAELVYRRAFINSEFFPLDIDQILQNELSIGTFMAMPKEFASIWNPESDTLPPSFAMLSVWNTKEVFKLQVKGMSKMKYACSKMSRFMDIIMPWLKIPSIPNVFKNFGVYFLYGLHMEGTGASQLMRSLCSYAHNLASDDDQCGAVVAEVALLDPVRDSIPYWESFSVAEDLWGIKNLRDDSGLSDWSEAPSSAPVIFVDPRDF